MGNAVERIFIAIKAEMDRRAKLLADGRVGDLVDYRKRVIPKLKPGDPLPNTFPHLFVIVDEFAEMLTQNPEYQAQFESITRLGRAFGVTLILATQRPAGVVSDQMRANMKFRVCLRVETADDSKELLKRPDAATLPAIGGRGYIQVGGGSLTEIQVAWAGAEYERRQARPGVHDRRNPGGDEPQAGEQARPADRLDRGRHRGRRRAAQGIPKQYKPWPNPAARELPLNLPDRRRPISPAGTAAGGRARPAPLSIGWRTTPTSRSGRRWTGRPPWTLKSELSACWTIPTWPSSAC